MKYEIIIWWSEENSAFLAEIPELPGCMADGANKEEALANIDHATTHWLDEARSQDRAIPEPLGRLRYE